MFFVIELLLLHCKLEGERHFPLHRTFEKEMHMGKQRGNRKTNRKSYATFGMQRCYIYQSGKAINLHVLCPILHNEILLSPKCWGPVFSGKEGLGPIPAAVVKF